MRKLIFICLILALPQISFANERSIPLELFTAKKIQHSGKLKIDILGKMHEVSIIEDSPYDSENILLRA